MKYKVLISPDVFRYFKKANKKIQKRMYQDINKFSDCDIDKLINRKEIDKKSELYFYNIRNNVVIVFTMNEGKICIFDYVHITDGDIYSIMAKGNPFTVKPQNSENNENDEHPNPPVSAEM